MSNSCSLADRDKRLAEQREHAAWTTGVLDLPHCSRLELVVTLYEHEEAGLRPETWPRAVLAIIDQHLAEWVERNKDRAVRALTYAAPKHGKVQSCIVVLHHAARSGG